MKKVHKDTPLGKKEACIGLRPRVLLNTRTPIARTLPLGLQCIFVAMICLFVSVSLSWSATFEVTKTADTNDGVCDADCSLREAIIAANANPGPDTIIVSAGVYILTIAGVDEDAAATGDLDITDELTISGSGANTTVIDGNALDRVLHIRPGASVTITGLTIRNGNTYSQGFIPGNGPILRNIGGFPFDPGYFFPSFAAVGGGIFNEGTLAVTNSIVSGNTAIPVDVGGVGAGGGIFNALGATLTLANSTVSGNTAQNWAGGLMNLGHATLTASILSSNTTTTDGWAGGILNDAGATLALVDSTVSNNTAQFGGGGILNFGGTAMLSNSTVSGNTGSGIWNWGGTLSLVNSTVSRNNTYYLDGGAILNLRGTLTLTSSTVSGNTAQGSIGGIWNAGGTAMLTNSTVSGNTAPYAGGILNEPSNDYLTGTIFDGILTMTNSTVSSNTAQYGGGGISNFGLATLRNTTVSGNSGGGIMNDQETIQGIEVGGRLTMNNVTIANNTADILNDGGGIDNVGTITAVNFKNTIIAGNTDISGNASDCFGTLNSEGYNLVQNTTGCTIVGGPTGNVIGQDANLGPLLDNGGPTQTHALLAGSPAIDAGNPSLPGSGGNACEATDLRGIPRPQSVRCDIGAFEAFGNTLLGTDVSVAFKGDETSPGGITVVFANVGTAGDTTLDRSITGPIPPAGFQLGVPPTYYEITTTATFTGTVTICIAYNPTQYSDPNDLRLFHFENDIWTNVTTSHNTTTHVICGQVTSLSPFAVLQGALTPSTAISELTPAKVWVGLKNSDDVGTRFDLAASVNLAGTEISGFRLNVGTGETIDTDDELLGLWGGSSGFNNAQLDSIPLNLPKPVFLAPGDTLSITLWVRNACPPANTHNSGTARLWFNGQQIGSGTTRDASTRFDVTVNGVNKTLFLREAGALNETAGSAREYIDVAAGAPCSPFKPFGIWSIRLP